MTKALQIAWAVRVRLESLTYSIQLQCYPISRTGMLCFWPSALRSQSSALWLLSLAFVTVRAFVNSREFGTKTCSFSRSSTV